MSQDHEFAQFLRTIGRGPRLSRPLQRAEAHEALRLVLEGRVDPVRLGAFLLVLRYRGETPEQLAGMIEAARENFSGTPAGTPAGPVADLDWPSYADRHRQQPWCVLAARLLAVNGVKVLMHGIAGYSDGYAPTRPALAALGLRPSASLAEAAERLARHNLAYLGLESFCAPLDRLFALCQLQGVFHPPYRTRHQEVAVLEGQPVAAIFKGGAGEVQRNPLKPCRVAWVRDGETGEEDWPALLPDAAHKWRGEPLDPERVAALWRGEIDLPAPEAAVTGTVALALSALGRAEDRTEAQAMAEAMWRARPHKNL